MGPLQRIAERFWFLPGLMCVAAVILSEALISVDSHLDEPVSSGWAGTLFYRIGEAGTRDILGTIAAASLGVAGTTFSITMAVLALTSSSYGPRLVRNFMADRGNQTVLGVFVATFLYSLLVLRSVGSASNASSAGTAFVPHLAVNTAIVLAIANVAAMVYFIHHISDSIQIATLSGGVRADLLAVIDRMYPESFGAAPPQGPSRPEPDPTDGLHVHADQHGYVQTIDGRELLDLMVGADLMAVLHVSPGHYVLDDTVLVSLHPAGRVSSATREAARATFQISNARNPYQDIDFSVQQLTEMAVRALSPGTNDPNTAINALDDLSSGLARLASREVPSPVRVGDDDTPRVYAHVADPTGLVTGVVDQMRWYAASSPSVMHATLTFIERVGERARNAALRRELTDQVVLVRETFVSAGHHPHDVADFEARAMEVAANLAGHRS
ncbi:MAG: DUF2254 domain-containing protein [Pedococcus sp.]